MENTDGKRKTAPSIPANYISILQLQERWINEKNRKRKEEKEEERRRKQQMIEEDLKKAEVVEKQEERNKFEDKCLDRSNRNHWDGNSRKKDIDGGEAISAEKDEPEVTAAIGSERGEDSTPIVEELQENKRGIRKRYDSKKKKTNKDVVECGSIAPPEIIKTENKTPVNDGIQVYNKKGEKATGKKKSIGSREKAVTAIETKFENLSIKEEQIRSSNRNGRNQRQPQRVRMPIGTATMVWVKKGQNERAEQ